MKKPQWLVLFAALALTSCSTMDAIDLIANAAKPKPAPGQPAPPPPQNMGPAPQTAPVSPPPSQQQGSKVPDPMAAADFAKYSNPAQSNKSYGAGADLTTLKSAAINPGEWAVYRQLEGGKVKAVVKMAVVGKDGDAWIYEFASYSEGENAAIQEAVQGLDDIVQSGSADKGKVVWLKVKDREGKVQTLDGAMLGMGGAAYKNMLTANAARYSAGATDGGSVKVPAGTFASTWKVQSQVSRGKVAAQGTAWVSTLVPLWHLIKSISDDGNTSMELVDFGSSGYLSAFR